MLRIRSWPAAVKITALCTITVALPLIVLEGLFLWRTGRENRLIQRNAARDYLFAVAQGVQERVLLIEECAGALRNSQELTKYLRRDFTMNAASVLNVSNNLYPLVTMLAAIHRDVVQSISVYSPNPTHPEIGKGFQSISSLTEPEILDFWQSDAASAWLVDVENPLDRYDTRAERTRVHMYAVKVFAGNGDKIGFIAVSTRESMLFPELSQNSGEYFWTLTPDAASVSAGTISQAIPRLGVALLINIPSSRSLMNMPLSALGITAATAAGLALLSWLVRGIVSPPLAEQEKRQRNAQLQALQYQLNPHFLYNSLYMLQLSIENAELWNLANAVSWFADILQYNLRGTSEKALLQATFAEEITHIQSYIRFINAFRDTPITIAVKCPPELAGRRFLRFVFQPLAENAIQYGGSGMKRIGISIGQRGGLCEISVFNDGESISGDMLSRVNDALRLAGESASGSSAETGLGEVQRIGLRNIARRLSVFYPGKAEIYLTNGERTCVHILFPLDSNSKMGKPWRRING
jgi:signal transduction histidine kinase